MGQTGEARALSRTQRFVLAILPRNWAADVERESREWVMTCSKCGSRQSVWDAGGVRWKAKGAPTVAARCSGCSRVTRHSLAHESVSAP